MNRNENEQFKKLEEFIKEENKNKDDIFYGAKKIESTNIDGYDAIAHFTKGNLKHIQITTMNNLVLKKKGCVQHANKRDLSLENNFDKKDIDNNIDYLKKMGIYRKIIKHNEEELYVSDSFSQFVNDEEDLDKKYDINTANLTNALYRSIKKKMNKYNDNIKKKNSCLVIIDESLNNFFLKKIVNFKIFNSEKIDILKNFHNIQNYFNFILEIIILETKFNKQTFFDEIQVYFKLNFDPKHKYRLSNNYISSNVNLNTEKIGMRQWVATPLKYKRMISRRNKDKK